MKVKSVRLIPSVVFTLICASGVTLAQWLHHPTADESRTRTPLIRSRVTDIRD
jgi:hypothetical protein